MKKILVIAAVLYSAAAVAQTGGSSKPPMVGDKPLVQVKPRGAAKNAQPADAAKAAPGKPKSMAQKLQACLEIDDGTKDRLNCYDAVIAPKPNPKAKAPVKSVTQCGGFKDEEERLTCFNGFVEKLPKLPS
jgi:cell division protein FtsN